MALPSATVTGHITDSEGTAVENAIAVFRLTRPDTDDGVIVPEKEEARTDANGDLSVELWPNTEGTTDSQYHVTVRHPDTGEYLVDSYMVVPSGGGTLSSLLQLDHAPEPVESWQSTAKAYNHAQTSKRYASEDEDTTVVEVESGADTGTYSSLHHAAKSGKSATTAERFANEGEDTTVVDALTGNDTGTYSSKHHRAKSEQAQAASESARDASQSARDASQAARDDSDEHATTSERWATETGGTVVDEDSGTDSGEYSAKEYAQGSQAGTGGSSKNWAQKVGAAVVSGLYSAKEWAVGTFTRGTAGGGSAKDWATLTGETVDDAAYSAKEHAQGDVEGHGGSARAWAIDASSPDASGEKSAKTLAGEASTSAGNAATSESNAADSETAAADSESAAATSESNAASSETSAGNHETTAGRWANEDEGVTVIDAETGQDTGEYSAYHWKKKAQSEASTSMQYRGGWDASTGSYPDNPDQGDMHKVGTAGTVDGVEYKVGDSIIHNGGDPTLSSGWDHIDNTESVTSVAGKVGDVSLGHNTDLNNLQGGTSGEYYHLTNQQHSYVSHLGSNPLENNDFATTAEHEAGSSTAKVANPAGVHAAFNQYGLGAATSALPTANDLTTSITPGTYRLQPDDTKGAPFSSGWWHVVIVNQSGGSRYSFILLPAHDDPTPDVYLGQRDTDTGDPVWTRMLLGDDLAANGGTVPETDKNETIDGTWTFNAPAGNGLILAGNGGGDLFFRNNDATNEWTLNHRNGGGLDVVLDGTNVFKFGDDGSLSKDGLAKKGSGAINGELYDNNEAVGPIESGTWTPVLEGATTAGSHSYNNQNGYYIRRGSSVHLEIEIELASLDANAAGTLRITGLPYFAAHSNLPVGKISYATNISYPSNLLEFMPRIVTGAQFDFRYLSSSGGSSSFDISNASDSTFIRITVDYEI